MFFDDTQFYFILQSVTKHPYSNGNQNGHAFTNDELLPVALLKRLFLS